MNLSGIRPSIGFYDNNPIKTRPEINPIPAEPTPDTQQQQQRQAQGFGDEPAATVEISREGIIAVKKNVEKAVSDMERDTTLHQYQYFVKDKPAADVAVERQIEYFSL